MLNIKYEASGVQSFLSHTCLLSHLAVIRTCSKAPPTLTGQHNITHLKHAIVLQPSQMTDGRVAIVAAVLASAAAAAAAAPDVRSEIIRVIYA